MRVYDGDEMKSSLYRHHLCAARLDADRQRAREEDRERAERKSEAVRCRERRAAERAGHLERRTIIEQPRDIVENIRLPRRARGSCPARALLSGDS